MIKHSDIIEKLSVDQKLHILTDGSYLASLHQINPDVPVLNVKTLFDYISSSENDEVYPSATALANTWGEEVVEEAAKSIALRARAEGVNAAVLPDAKMRGSVYSKGLSEDPVLSGMIAGAMARGAAQAGVTPIVSACALDNTDMDFADEQVDVNIIMNYYLLPYRLAMKSCDKAAIGTTSTLLRGVYSDANVGLVGRLMRREIASGKFTVTLKENADLAVKNINEGNTLCLKGHYRVLKEALEHYKDLSDSIESGTANTEELTDAINSGMALSEETLDEAVDSIIDFAFKCGSYPPPEKEKADEIAKKALKLAEKTVVLLKNEENILPIHAHRKVAVIGQLSNIEGVPSVYEVLGRREKEYKLQSVGYEDGYDLNRPRSDELIASAVNLANKADVLVVFVGFDEKKEKKIHATRSVKLPGSQAALLYALKKTGKKIIAVVVGSGRLDMKFDKMCDGVIFAPHAGSQWSQAIVNVLSGKTSPSGKLPFCMYDNAEEYFTRIKNYKKYGRNKVGPFIGYRKSEAEGDPIKYPLGYGLSYTKFKLSGIRVSQAGVRLVVKNVGHKTSSEVVQIYVKKVGSHITRPGKELKYFERVTLKPGQRKLVFKELKHLNLGVYDESKGEWITEDGRYQIMIGTSLKDIQFQTTIRISGTVIKKEKEKESNYLQCRSNILSGGYVMKKTVENKNYKCRMKGFAIFTIILAVILDLAYVGLFEIMPIFNYQLVNADSYVLYVQIASGALTLLTILSLILWRVSAKRIERRKEHDKYVAQHTKTEKDKNEPVYAPSPYEQLFLQEFPEDEVFDDDDEEEEASFIEEEERDEYYKEGWTYEQMCDAFIPFAAERGVVVDKAMARSVFSAMITTRLIVFKAERAFMVNKFYEVLSEYLGCHDYKDSTVEYMTTDDMLYTHDEEGTYTETDVLRALVAADHDKYAMHTALLNDVKLTAVGSYFVQFTRYAAHPDRPYNIAMKNKNVSDKIYSMSPNLWFFMAVADGERLDNLPTIIAESAAVINLNYTIGEEVFDKTASSHVSYLQFLYFGFQAKNRFELTEDLWKKVDKLEGYIAARTEYHISNKLWQKLERCAAVLLALGCEKDEALDEMLAIKLLPTILPLVEKSKRENDEQFVHVLENIFGDDKVEKSVKLVEISGVDSNI